MITKLLHTADLHMGARQYGFIQREHDYYVAVERIFGIAISEKVDAIILAGDIFDAAKPPAHAVWVLQSQVARARNAGIEVLGIDGNHDSCDKHWLRVCGVTPLEKIPTIVKGCRISGIDATRLSEFNSTLSEMDNHGIKTDILVMHQAVSELIDFITDFTCVDIAARVKPLGVGYVALGDIHGYKETVVDGVRFCYPGSPEVTALDQDNEKYVQIVTFDGKDFRTAPVQLRPRQFKTYRLTQETDIDQILTDSNLAEKPLLIVSYAAKDREIAKRAEAVLRTSSLVYRMYPVSEEGDVRETVAKRTFERGGAIGQLKAAVEDYFDPTSEESQLVFQLLDAPDNVKPIVNQYLKGKNLL